MYFIGVNRDQNPESRSQAIIGFVKHFQIAAKVNRSSSNLYFVCTNFN